MALGYWVKDISVQGNVIYFYIGISGDCWSITLKDSTGKALGTQSGCSYGNYAFGVPGPGVYTLELYCNWKNAVCESGTVTVSAPKPSIAAIAANPSDVPGYPADQGWIRVSVRLLNGGSFKILVDGVEVKRDGPFNGDYTLDYNIKMSPGTHQVCAEVI